MYVTIHDATEKERLLQQLHNKAKYDYLTNIYNRGAFFERAEQIITSAQSGAIFIALLLDVDNFKAINDHYGHSCGDYVLKTLCGEIRNSMVPFPTSIFGRYGGEEFSFLFDTLTVEQVLTFAENFRERIANLAVEWQGQLIPFTISIGISSGMKTESFLLEELFLKADVALYQAKNNGKNCVILYKNEQNLEGFSSAN
ncbi:hypothetical protein BAU17_06190 [Enterococcus sp. CU12B]|uniref:GGDEF domain-containing protein n=2 Tax=Enterococcus TaxID=1350 RepID=A0ABQ6YW97_9ENTE|nr:hypothetical protein BAU17_06190 [Enterococcus sp. CU12B]